MSRASTPSSILFEPMPYGEMQNSPRRTAGSGFGNLNGNNKDSIDINVSIRSYSWLPCLRVLDTSARAAGARFTPRNLPDHNILQLSVTMMLQGSCRRHPRIHNPLLQTTIFLFRIIVRFFEILFLYVLSPETISRFLSLSLSAFSPLFLHTGKALEIRHTARAVAPSSALLAWRPVQPGRGMNDGATSCPSL